MTVLSTQFPALEQSLRQRAHDEVDGLDTTELARECIQAGLDRPMIIKYLSKNPNFFRESLIHTTVDQQAFVMMVLTHPARLMGFRDVSIDLLKKLEDIRFQCIGDDNNRMMVIREAIATAENVNVEYTDAVVNSWNNICGDAPYCPNYEDLKDDDDSESGGDGNVHAAAA